MSNATTAPSGFFISSIFQQGWELFKKNWLKIYGLLLAPYGLAFGYSLFVQPNLEGVVAGVAYVAYLVLSMIVGMGISKAFMVMTRGEEVKLDEILQEVAPRFLRYVGGTILYALTVIVGLVLLVVPGIVWAIKYAFVPQLIIDKDISVSEAFETSGRMTEGVKWDLIGFSMALAVLVYSGILALIVGVVVTVPLSTVCYIMFYNLLLKRAEK